MRKWGYQFRGGKRLREAIREEKTFDTLKILSEELIRFERVLEDRYIIE